MATTGYTVSEFLQLHCTRYMTLHPLHDIAHGLVSKNVGWLGLFTLVEQQRGPATAPISLLFARRERAAIAGTCNDVVIVATHPVVVAAATFVSSAVC